MITSAETRWVREYDLRARHPRFRRLESHFTCHGCKRLRPYSFGAVDDMPDHCDDCWASAHKETP